MKAAGPSTPPPRIPRTHRGTGGRRRSQATSRPRRGDSRAPAGPPPPDAAAPRSKRCGLQRCSRWAPAAARQREMHRLLLLLPLLLQPEGLPPARPGRPPPRRRAAHRTRRRRQAGVGARCAAACRCLIGYPPSVVARCTEQRAGTLQGQPPKWLDQISGFCGLCVVQMVRVDVEEISRALWGSGNGIAPHPLPHPLPLLPLHSQTPPLLC